MKARTKSRPRQRIGVEDTYDDTIVITLKDGTFVINHNNMLTCHCILCNGINSGIENAWDRHIYKTHAGAD